MNIAQYRRLVEATETGLDVHPIMTGRSRRRKQPMTASECKTFWRNRCISSILESARKYGQEDLAETYIAYLEEAVYDPYEAWALYTDISTAVEDFEEFATVA